MENKIKKNIEDGLRLRLLHDTTPRKALGHALGLIRAHKNLPVALAMVTASILPENLARNLKNSLAGIDKGVLPFNIKELKEFKEGWNSDVFLLEDAQSNESYVIKILRGRYGTEAHKKIKQQLQKEWKRAQEEINSEKLPYKIVPDEFFVVADVGDRVAAINVQKFVGHNTRDFVHNMDESEILALSKKDSDFKIVLKHFLDRVVYEWEENGILYDFTGKENLLITVDASTKKNRLYFVDPHDIVSMQNGDTASIDKRVAYLKHLQKILRALEAV